MDSIDAYVDFAEQVLDERHAQDIVRISISEKSSLADYFLVCHGDSTVQVKAIADELSSRLQEEFDLEPLSVEGMDNREWILLDYGDFIVHVFNKQAREYYALEKLWSSQEDLEARPASRS